MKRFFVSLALIVGQLVAIPPVANGIVNGKEIIGSDYVVTLLPLGKNKDGFCTGVYFSERVVVTAAHCVIRDQGRAPELRFSLDNFYVAQTGINWKNSNSKINAVRVLKIWTEPDYFNRWNPAQNQKETTINDVAFLFLEKPLAGKHISRSANSSELEDFKRGSGTAFHLGYGCTGGKDSNSLIYDGSPYRVDGITGTTRTDPYILLKERLLIIDYPTGTSVCPGDSGSPLLMQKGDDVLYLGTIFAGAGWLDVSGNLSARGGEASVTVFWPFQAKLELELYKFLENEKAESEKKAIALKEKQEAEKALLRDREVAIIEKTFYRENSGCHAIGTNAELQVLNDGVWRSLVQAKGWDAVANCPSTHPVQPWTIAEIEQPSKLRWRFWAVGVFDIFGSQFQSQLSAKAAAELKAKQETEAKAAAELKAKQETEAKVAADKAAAELKAKQEADIKAAAELKAKQDAAADKAAFANAQSELAAANAALADSQRLNRELQTQLNSIEVQFKLLSDSVSVIQGKVSQLNSKLAAALAGQNAANAKLKKVCSAKPRPKGC